MTDEQNTVEQREDWTGEPPEVGDLNEVDELDEPYALELPRRPRRRLLTPVPLALLGVLVTVCGFIAGVLVEKGQGSAGGSGGGGALASRLGALRATAGGGAGAGGCAAAGAGPTGAFFGAGRAGATIGQVAYISGHTLYVTTAEGSTVKVRTSAASTVTKTVKASVKGIHPGEAVVVTGSRGANGSVDAESIRVSEAGGLGGGGLAALFGSGGRGGGSSGGSGSSGGGESAGGGPALFGK